MASSPRRTGHGEKVPRAQILASITDAHVLRAMYDSPEPISRAEIAERTGLSKPTASTAMSRLANRGIVQEVGIRGGRHGGVATLFRIDPDHGSSLAVVIQNDAITVQSRDLTGSIRAHRSVAITPATEPDEVVVRANVLIEAAAQTGAGPVLAATVSIADPIDASTGIPAVLERSVFPGALIDPRRDLALPEGIDPLVDNDVNWAARGELHEGALRDCANFVYVYVGEGLGAGLVLDGRLFRGARGLAGEIGYLRTDHGRDITEVLADLGLGTPTRYGLEPDRFAALAPDAAAAVIEVIARAVANVAIVLNPAAVALGGPLTKAPGFADRLSGQIREFTIDPPRVVVSESSPLLGAAREAHARALEAIGLTTDFPAGAEGTR